MKKIKTLSVFFPVFNEEKNIPLFVNEILDILPNIADKFEIIIINDGSNDSSKKIAENISRKYKNIKIVNHKKNLGYGAALKTGFKASIYEWVFFTDGDLQFDISQIKNFIKETDKFDVIIGYRKNRADGKIRTLNANLFKLYINMLFRLHVKDIDCAFKLIRAKKIKELDLISSGAFTTAEFLYKLKKKGINFKQLPVSHYQRRFGKQSGNNPKVIIKAGLEALKLYAQIKFKIIFK